MAAAATSTARPEPWRRRLYVPNYQVREAARYAGVSSQTVLNWQKAGLKQTIASREMREALSYMQLIEVAVVAKMRKAGVRPPEIRATREYVSKKLRSEYPFAEYRFKTDGKKLFMDYEQVEGKKGRGKLLRPGQNGQLAWEEVIGRLLEFEYEHKGIAIRWHVAGRGSSVLIDPRVAFGAPMVRGTPTWAIRGRWEAGETIDEIADDFGLTENEVRDALTFEGIDYSTPLSKWTH